MKIVCGNHRSTPFWFIKRKMPPTKTINITMTANKRGGSHDMNAGTIMYAAVKPINTNCARIDHSLWKSRQFGSNHNACR